MNSLKRMYKNWIALGKLIGNFVGHSLMRLFYFTFVAPFGIGVRYFLRPLRFIGAGGQWQPRENQDPTLEGSRREF